MYAVDIYEKKRKIRHEKRAAEGELNPNQNLTNHVSNSILERITNDEGKTVSSPSGVDFSGKTKDLMFHNKILEAYLSINILNEPGEIGTFIDQFTSKLERVFHALNREDIATLPVVFNGNNKTLKDVFNATTFNPLSASSDQIGRMPKGVEKKVEDWLSDELKSPANSGNFKRVLTKIKAISSFGTTMWQLLSPGIQINSESVQRLLEASVLDGPVKSKNWFEEFRGKTRSSLFDDPITRARSERMPLLNGIPVKGIYSDAASHGLGFGQVVQASEDRFETEQLEKLLAGSGAKNSQINAILRQNAPIGDLNRPYMLSEDEYGHIPEAYSRFNVKTKIEGHSFNHGVGINRWQPYGSYGAQANLSGFPSAGAQSGGTTDVMLALQMLSGGKIYNPESSRAVEAITLAVGAFMNFGGYHTFSEVYPVGMSVAGNQVMNPATTAAGFRHSPLYLEMLESHGKFNEATNSNIREFFNNYRAQTISHRNPTLLEEE